MPDPMAPMKSAPYTASKAPSNPRQRSANLALFSAVLVKTTHADVGFDRPTARFPQPPPPLAPYRSDSARTASTTCASSRRYSSSPLRQ